MEQTYAKFKNSDLSLKEVCDIIEQMAMKDMTFDEFQHYYPMADELSWALEAHLTGSTFEESPARNGDVRALPVFWGAT